MDVFGIMINALKAMFPSWEFTFYQGDSIKIMDTDEYTCVDRLVATIDRGPAIQEIVLKYEAQNLPTTTMRERLAVDMIKMLKGLEANEKD